MSGLFDTLPAMAPPPGKESHLHDASYDGSSRSLVLVLGSTLACVMIFSCTAKVYTRSKMDALHWDDGCAIIATICAVAYYIVIVNASQKLLDVHMWNISIARVLNNIPSLRAIGYVYFPTLFFSKLAFMAFLFRLFSEKPIMRPLLWIALTTTSTTSIMGLVWSIIACPSRGIHFMLCSRRVFVPHLVAAGFNIFNDVWLFAISLCGVLSSGMTQPQKRGALIMFMTGLCPVGAAVVGIYYRAVLLRTDDVTWRFTGVNLLSVCEIDTTIIVTCLPSLRPLHRMLQRWAHDGHQKIISYSSWGTSQLAVWSFDPLSVPLRVNLVETIAPRLPKIHIGTGLWSGDWGWVSSVVREASAKAGYF